MHPVYGTVMREEVTHNASTSARHGGDELMSVTTAPPNINQWILKTHNVLGTLLRVCRLHFIESSQSFHHIAMYNPTLQMRELKFRRVVTTLNHTGSKCQRPELNLSLLESKAVLVTSLQHTFSNTCFSEYLKEAVFESLKHIINFKER